MRDPARLQKKNIFRGFNRAGLAPRALSQQKRQMCKRTGSALAAVFKNSACQRRGGKACHMPLLGMHMRDSRGAPSNASHASSAGTGCLQAPARPGATMMQSRKKRRGTYCGPGEMGWAQWHCPLPLSTRNGAKATAWRGRTPGYEPRHCSGRHCAILHFTDSGTLRAALHFLSNHTLQKAKEKRDGQSSLLIPKTERITPRCPRRSSPFPWQSGV